MKPQLIDRIGLRISTTDGNYVQQVPTCQSRIVYERAK